jgi:hypothetical protein
LVVVMIEEEVRRAAYVYVQCLRLLSQCLLLVVRQEAPLAGAGDGETKGVDICQWWWWQNKGC